MFSSGDKNPKIEALGAEEAFNPKRRTKGIRRANEKFARSPNN